MKKTAPELVVLRLVGKISFRWMKEMQAEPELNILPAMTKTAMAQLGRSIK